MHNHNKISLSLPVSAWLLLITVFSGIVINIVVNILPLSLEEKLIISFVFVIIAYSQIFLTLKILYKNVKFIHIFLLLTIPFSYGQHFIALFDRDYLFQNQDYHILDGLLADSSIINASFFIILFLILLTFGYIIVNKQENYSQEMITREEKTTDKILLFVGLLFLAISFIPAFKEVLGQYNLSKTYSYLARRNLEHESNYFQLLGISSRDTYLAEWFLPSLYMILISLKTKRARVIPYFILLGYSSIYLLTGSRFILLKMATVVFLIEYFWHHSFSKQALKKIFILAFPLAIVFSVMTKLRGTTDYNYASIADGLANYFKSSPLNSTLWETGITFTSVSNVIDKVPNSLPFFAGKSYLGAVLILLPAFLRFGFTERYTFTISSTLSPLYYRSKLFGYGSSIYAEQYYNFGYLSLIIAIFIGMMFGYFERKVHQNSFKHKSSSFLIYSFILGELIYSVRNDLYAIPRVTFISLGIPLIVVWLVRELINKSMYHKGDNQEVS